MKETIFRDEKGGLQFYSNTWLCVGRSKFDEDLQFDFQLDPGFLLDFFLLSPKFISNTVTFKLFPEEHPISN